METYEFDKDVLFITESKCYSSTSIVNLLRNQGFRVTCIDAAMNTLYSLRKDYQAVIFFEDEEVKVDENFFTFLKVYLVEKRIPAFFVSDAEKTAEFMKSLPSSIYQKLFSTSTDAKEIADDVAFRIKIESTHEKKKILVVDDSGFMLRKVKDWLEPQYEVLLANSGMSALKSLALNHPDLILLDYEMPVCDGKQVLEMIRAEDEFSKTPVIFLTNKNDKESVMNVKDLHPEGYLLKTMEKEKIIKVIDRFFEQQAAKRRG